MSKPNNVVKQIKAATRRVRKMAATYLPKIIEYFLRVTHPSSLGFSAVLNA